MKDKVLIDDDGAKYLPADAFGNEQELFLCAAFDGASVVRQDGRLYLPADWLAREYPEHAEGIQELIEAANQKGEHAP